MSEIDDLQRCIANGLDLCAMGRRLDEAEREFPASFTLHAWADELYKRKLEEWEAEAKRLLGL